MKEELVELIKELVAEEMSVIKEKLDRVNFEKLPYHHLGIAGGEYYPAVYLRGKKSKIPIPSPISVYVYFGDKKLAIPTFSLFDYLKRPISKLLFFLGYLDDAKPCDGPDLKDRFWYLPLFLSYYSWEDIKKHERKIFPYWILGKILTTFLRIKPGREIYVCIGNEDKKVSEEKVTERIIHEYFHAAQDARGDYIELVTGKKTLPELEKEAYSLSHKILYKIKFLTNR